MTLKATEVKQLYEEIKVNRPTNFSQIQRKQLRLPFYTNIKQISLGNLVEQTRPTSSEKGRVL